MLKLEDVKIEATVMLDTGMSGIVVPIADILGLDIQGVDALVFSHGHYDHTGGTRAVLARRTKPLRTIAHPDALRPKYSHRKETDPPQYVGIPFRRDALEGMGAEFEFTTQPTWLSESIVTSSEESMRSPFEKPADNLLVADGDGYAVDPMTDDQSLFVLTDQGLLILLGCAHRGMINIIECARELTGEERVYLVFGGTHLAPASPETQAATLEALEQIAPRWIGVSHRAGLEMATELRSRFPERFFPNNG